MNKPIKIEIPINMTGVSKGVKSEGGIMQILMRDLEISCLPVNIPEHFELDVSELGIGDSIHVRNLSIPNVDILSEPSNVVVVIVAPTIIKAEATTAEAALAAEGEAAEGAPAAGAAPAEAGKEAPGKKEAAGKKEEPKKEGRKEREVIFLFLNCFSLIPINQKPSSRRLFLFPLVIVPEITSYHPDQHQSQFLSILRV
jgi:large subunit ribosomal protein L25